MAEIFMDYIESKIHSDRQRKLCAFRRRYVDDIFVVFTETDKQLTLFLKFINILHKRIKFTVEIEENKSINFLDLTISRVNDYFDFSTFHKPTHTDSVIHFSSQHTFTQELSSFHVYIHRSLSTPLSTDNYNKELNFIRQVATNNGYKVE